MGNWKLGEKFGTVQPHHASAKALWEHEWRKSCTRGLYPFNYARVEDFDEVFAVLIENDINDAYDDTWTETFLPFIRNLEQHAIEAENAGRLDDASSLYLRANSLGFISRFPQICTPKKREAFEYQKKLYLKGTSFWPEPVKNVVIPHKYAANGDGSEIQMFVRLPQNASTSSPVPVLVYITGLDGYRTDTMPIGAAKMIAGGRAVMAVEIPGTGDSPAVPNDPESPDRFFSSVLDWIEEQPYLQHQKTVAWGTSTGGYYAIRLAHTHRKRISGVVAQGGCSHHIFSKEWLDHADGGEYAFSLTRALAQKWGYHSVEAMREDAMERFSLVKSGVLDKPCTRLLLVNGIEDSIFPVEDSMVCLEHGDAKEARFFHKSAHMGFPGAMPTILKFLDSCFTSEK